MPTTEPPRRSFFRRFSTLAGLSASSAAGASRPASRTAVIPAYARAQDYRSMKQSSFDRTGGNADYWPIPAGATKEVFRSSGPGVITHIWFTWSSKSATALKQLVLRMYWEGQERPSVETPLGDFFGLNLGEFFVYQSVFLDCAPNRALNAWFAMPFRKEARITITNEGTLEAGALYSNIDYQLVSSLPEDSMYFHAQYRQTAPTKAVTYPDGHEFNLAGERNYVFADIKGRGHLMGVTLGVLQHAERWMGEGDDMIFVDGEARPGINGTGLEDYFLGAYDFGGRDAALPFGHLYHGAPYISAAERTGGKYCAYRWHADNPVTFRKSLRHTIEHGHANDRGDSYYSVCYWYQSEPRGVEALPAAVQRVPQLIGNG